jgi:hypothetical protein
VGHERCRELGTERAAELDLGADPHPKLENQLELLGLVVPPIVVTERVRRQEVLYHMIATSTVGQYMVGLP